jgi:hypothetical protein
LALPHATAGYIVDSARDGGWAGEILEDLYGTPDPPEEFREFARWFDPARYAPDQHGLVMWTVGAQDEYFLLRDVGRTAQDLPDTARLGLLPNWDHRHFARGTGGAFNNTKAAHQRLDAARKRAIEAALHRKRPLPGPPQMDAEFGDDTIDVRVHADASQPVRAVRLWVSSDGAWFFDDQTLKSTAAGYERTLRLADARAAALFAEVEYGEGLCLTTPPALGPRFRQRIREP